VFKDIWSKFALIAGVAFAAGLMLTACGGGSSTIAQAEREQAEKHGREIAQEKAKEARLEQLERENRQAKRRKHEKERRELKEQQAHVSTPPSTSTSTSSTPSGTDCGGGTIAGPETSCGFALNTRAEYESYVGSGNGTVSAWSEANEEWYDMYCTEGSGHECSGAISATVYWP
jgi:hypothetical protein